MKERNLRNSHIIPKFLYADLKNKRGQMMGITGNGSKGWGPKQDGAKEQLLCESCESHLNTHYEQPFKKFWFDNAVLPDPWLDVKPRWLSTDYGPFKLFHLSVLFRASVSSLPMFGGVNLGPHEDRIRKMLFDRNPGKDYQYPIGGFGVVHDRSREIIKLITKPSKIKFGGKHGYEFIYGGAGWWFNVSTDRNPEFEKFSLKEDGKMCLSVTPWNEVPAVREASKALQGIVA